MSMGLFYSDLYGHFILHFTQPICNCVWGLFCPCFSPGDILLVQMALLGDIMKC